VPSGGSSSSVSVAIVLIGGILLVVAVVYGLVMNPTTRRSASWLSLVVVLVGSFAVMWVAKRMTLPVRTIAVTKSDGTTETVTGKFETKSYLVCPECGKRFVALGIGVSSWGPYTRDPERYATKKLRWHLIQVHHYERLEAQKTARTAHFFH
jgi:hypothetical protein